jgi:hypothetical protein
MGGDALAGAGARAGVVRPLAAGATETSDPRLIRGSRRESGRDEDAPEGPGAGRKCTLGRTLPEGALLDVPLRVDPLSRFAAMSHFIMLGGYHGRPVAACYNSFTVPILEQMAALAERIPDPAAIAALHALGYRGIVTHEEYLSPEERDRLRAALAAPAAGPLALVETGVAGWHHAFRID